jgi:hypothetical protein
MRFIKASLFFTAVCLTGSLLAQVKKTVTLTFQVKEQPVLGTDATYFSPCIVSDERILVVGDKEYDLLNQGENKWKKRKLYNLLLLPIVSWNLDSIAVGTPDFFDPSFVVNSHTGPASWNKAKNILVYSQVLPGKRKTIPLETPLEGVKPGNKKYYYPELY